MRGDKKVIEFLNEALKNELTAINQYFLHYRMLDNWGMTKLAKFEYGESIDEMKHADKLAERILFLDGLPNFQSLGRLRIGENVEEVLKADLELEEEALPLLRDAIQHCAAFARGVRPHGCHACGCASQTGSGRQSGHSKDRGPNAIGERRRRSRLHGHRGVHQVHRL